MQVKIGLETHVQLNSRSKMFCGCLNPANLTEEPEPNTLTCPTCLGHPGSKPRANAAVLGMALRVATALGFRISRETFFSRKTYFYPDMPRNFQITQYEVPVGVGGALEIDAGGGKRTIRLRRLHMEEDPARLVHVGGMGVAGSKHVLVDYNRSGIPLLEIVTEPDLRTPAEARTYLQKLTSILEYLGVYDSATRAVLKSDANISLSAGRVKGGRIEVKNITGAKEVEQALGFELVRQRSLASKGMAVKQATRMWDPDMQSTREMRTKETEEDYGYIFEPDLTVMDAGQADVRRIRSGLPELPDQRRRRLVKQYAIPEKLAESLVSEKELSDLFEAASKKVSPKTAAGWISGYLKKTLNWNGLKLKQSGIREEWVIELLKEFEDGRLTDRNAELVLRKMVEDHLPPSDVIRNEGYGKVESSEEVEALVRSVLDKHPKPVDDLRRGESKALHYLVGLCMKETRGRIDAKTLREIITRLVK
jgi:aspartyl-tRNA(Asn)/glutamyl-tRNA(Gln) amidotransferase subunit B